jgi:hypothetical protein
MRKTSWTIVAGLCIFACQIASASIWYVDAGVPSSGDGTSWETAFKKIQEGIDAAWDGETVMVAEGAYVENINFKGMNITLTSTDPTDPNVVANTIIDGNQAGSVVTFDGTEDETCVLSGFTIRNGKADKGGGICGGRPVVRTRATIQNNIITANSATSVGGGVEGGGGVAWCCGLIQNNIISRNSVVWDGGGLYGCSGVIESNTISENSSYEGGGLSGCNGVIRNNIIRANSATWEGGGGGGLHNCYAVIENNLITGNSAVRGGGLRLCGGKIIQGNTIAGNSASELGGGLCMCEGTIRNCIMWGNTAGGAPDQNYDFSAASFCCIQGWTGGGTGNIAERPQFTKGGYRLQAGSPCIDKGANYYWFAWPQRDLDGNCRLVGGSVDIGCYEHGSSLDSDGDLLSETEESSKGTDPGNCDTDGDGLRDGVEVLRGTDPLETTPPATVGVPGSVPTIQQALSLAMPGDEIIVAPGTYSGSLVFCGADVVLRSSGPDDPATVASTILDGAALGPVVTFTGFESEACVLSGFTVRNGNALLGGGIFGKLGYRSATSATIEKNVITGNTAMSRWREAYGGGLCGCNGLVRNNIITRNSVSGGSGDSRGGGLESCNGVIESNTITLNSVSGQFGWGGGLASCGDTIQNCIIWGNTAARGDQLLESSAPTYCCIQNWAEGGEGNIADDPRFANLGGDDYRLSGDSPCIDAGLNESWMWGSVDLDGNERISDGDDDGSAVVDMGAYEYRFVLRVLEATRTAEGGVELIWNSRPGDSYIISICPDLGTWLWIPVATVPSAGLSTTWTDPDITLTRKMFYRISVD